MEPSDLISKDQTEGCIAASGYTAWIFRRFAPYLGRRVCDLGAGHGVLSSFLADRERLVCVDKSPDALASLRERFVGKDNVTVVEADLETSDLGFLKQERIDTVISINVLEHLKDDVGLLSRLARNLDPRGRLLLMLPAHPFLFCDIDRRCNHKRRYGRGQIASAMAQGGFELESCRAFNLPGLAIYAWQGLLLRRKQGFFEAASPGSAGTMARFIKAYSALEDRLPLPLGLSWLCRARPAAGSGGA